MSTTGDQITKSKYIMYSMKLQLCVFPVQIVDIMETETEERVNHALPSS